MISKYAKVHVIIGIGLIVASVVCVIFITPNIAPEFSGSAKMHIEFLEEQEQKDITEKLVSVEYEATINQVSGKEYLITTRSLNEKEYAALKNILTDTVGEYEIKEYQSFSPSISAELLYKAIIALILAVVIIILYISFVFRKSSRPVASWKYGMAATLALIHDTIIPLGLFSVLAQFTTAAIDTLFVTALLATLGYSINDTIVVFDRMRDRLRMNREKNKKEDFNETVEYGVKNSLRRSVYTSVSTVTPLVLLFIFVSATKWFSIALFAGIVAGTYSSLFFAPSLLLLWQRYFPQKEKKEKQLSETEAAEKILRETIYNEDIL